MKWEKLPTQGAEGSPLARSSHTIISIGQKLFVFGGEHEPRQPVDNVLYCYDLSERQWDKPTPAKGDGAPAARVGHAAAALGGKLYVFGGRTGVDQGETALGDLHCFDQQAGQWEKVGASGGPPKRSYHAMAATATHLYVFGGCGEGGRLNDLWEYDPASDSWKQLPSSPHIKGRGGAGLAASADGASLYVVAGFCGEEMSDVHRYDIATGAWDCPGCCAQTTSSTLPPRSVFGIGAHACGVCAHGDHILLFGGEVDPSTQGHEGAGAFSNEVYCMDTMTPKAGDATKGGEGPAAGGRWHKVQPQGEAPRPRGWFAAATVPSGMVVHGGNNDDNKRMDDMWLLAAHG